MMYAHRFVRCDHFTLPRLHKRGIIQAYRDVILPFVAYPGLTVVFPVSGKALDSAFSAVQVSAVEWHVADSRFIAETDEDSNVTSELDEAEIRSWYAEYGWTVELVKYSKAS